MEFETLKKSHIKRNIVIGVVAVLIISAIVLTFTRAKYRVTASIPLVNGTINYSLADLNIIAIKVDGESVDTMPKGNYELLDTSYCTIDGEDTSVTLSWDQATQTLSVIPFTTKGTKCYLNFKKIIPTKEVDTTLGTIKVNLDTPDFSKTSCSSGCGEATVGIYEETTSKGTTYYWRGDVENNYLEFAGFYWRIIQINEDGSIRAIYNGNKEEVDAAGKETVLANGYDDSSTEYTQIGWTEYNYPEFINEYVGYTYTIGLQRPNVQNGGDTSRIKKFIDNWYDSNLMNYDSMIVSSPGFCNDRNVASGYEWSSQPTSDLFYAANERIVNGTPNFECSNSNDLYTIKVGLITADEAVYAGGQFEDNLKYYLYTGLNYWTMSPVYYMPNFASMIIIYDTGVVINADWIVSAYAARPVINISSNVTITGSGTISDPYIVN